ncbi:hypothetical protein CF326_g4962 [Tilletia indica]|nr:hypothetical protein CF326_g4962 [Tilletia indica]
MTTSAQALAAAELALAQAAIAFNASRDAAGSSATIASALAAHGIDVAAPATSEQRSALPQGNKGPLTSPPETPSQKSPRFPNSLVPPSFPTRQPLPEPGQPALAQTPDHPASIRWVIGFRV